MVQELQSQVEEPSDQPPGAVAEKPPYFLRGFFLSSPTIVSVETGMQY